MSHPRFLGAGLLAAATFHSAFAADAITEAPLTINITPLAATADDMVQPADVLNGDALLRQRSSNIGETLDAQLGVSNGSFGPGVGRPIIRGQAGPRVTVLQNGISSMDVSALSQDHAVSVDTTAVEQVEIIKGPATLLYGSGAIGGVVNIVDDRLPTVFRPGFSGDTGFSYGDNADQKSRYAHVNLGVGDGVMLHVDGAMHHASDLSIPGFANRDNTGAFETLPNSGVETQSGAVSASYIGARGNAGLSISRYSSVYGLPQEDTAFIELDQTRYDFKGVLRDPVRGFESISLKAGYNDYAHTEFEDVGVPGTQFINRQGDARIEAVHALLGGFRGVLGLQGSHRDFSAVGDEALLQPTKTREVGVFLIEQKAFGWGSVEGGVRVEDLEHQPNASIRRSFTPVSVSLGSLIEMGAQHHVRVNLARSERAPSPEELYAFGPHIATSNFERGLLTAGKETTQGIEIGFDRHDTAWTWTANAYYNRFDNYLFLRETDLNLDADGSDSTGNPNAGAGDGIADRVDEDGVFDPAGELLLVDYRQARARFYGAELETAYLFNFGSVSLQPRVFGDVVRGRLESGGNLPRINPARYGAGLVARYGQFTSDVSYTRVMRQDRVATLESQTQGFDLLGVDVNYDLQTPVGVLSLFVKGRNLLDDDARSHTSFVKDAVPQAGRNVISGFRLQF